MAAMGGGDGRFPGVILPQKTKLGQKFWVNKDDGFLPGWYFDQKFRGETAVIQNLRSIQTRSGSSSRFWRKTPSMIR